MTSSPAPRPYGLLLELTHRCPLHCPYCSNPLELARRDAELPVDVWQRVIREAAALGVLQVGISGGEPLAYAGLDEVIRVAGEAGMYTNLITSGVGLNAERAAALSAAGLDVVQISYQSHRASAADEIAGARVHQLKIDAVACVHEAGIPLGMNVVLHRRNIDDVRALIDFAAELGAIRLEVANAQLAGWAFKNARALIPTRSQVALAEDVVEAARARYAGRMEIVYVPPDYFSDRPKPCLHGWGARGMCIDPTGDVLPCQAARAISGLRFENIGDRDLRWIWEESESFNRFRGTDWMPEPCRSCPDKLLDFGGCRCQAALLTGDAANTDPVCGLSSARGAVDALISEATSESELSYRGTHRFAAGSP